MEYAELNTFQDFMAAMAQGMNIYKSKNGKDFHPVDYKPGKYYEIEFDDTLFKYIGVPK